MNIKNSEYKFYFSNNCKYCLELANLMKMRNILHKFSLVNVDYDHYPNFIDTVPSLHIPYMKLLEGKDTFTWVEGCNENDIDERYIKYENKKNVKRVLDYRDIFKDTFNK